MILQVAMPEFSAQWIPHITLCNLPRRDDGSSREPNVCPNHHLSMLLHLWVSLLLLCGKKYQKYTLFLENLQSSIVVLVDDTYIPFCLTTI